MLKCQKRKQHTIYRQQNDAKNYQQRIIIIIVDDDSLVNYHHHIKYKYLIHIIYELGFIFDFSFFLTDWLMVMIANNDYYGGCEDPFFQYLTNNIFFIRRPMMIVLFHLFQNTHLIYLYDWWLSFWLIDWLMDWWIVDCRMSKQNKLMLMVVMLLMMMMNGCRFSFAIWFNHHHYFKKIIWCVGEWKCRSFNIFPIYNHHYHHHHQFLNILSMDGHNIYIKL